MKCINCNKEWIVIQGFRYPERCPFCGLNINGNNIGSGHLGWIVSEYGIDVLKQKKRLIALIRDLYYQDEILQKRLIVSVNAGVASFYHEAFGLKDLLRKNKINQASKLLKETLGLGDNVVEAILDEFNSAIGLNKNVQTDFCDGDDAYYNLAISGSSRKTFIPLLKVSVQAGNKKAIKKYISYIRTNWKDYVTDEEWYDLNKAIASLDDEDSINAYKYVAFFDLYSADSVDEEFDSVDQLDKLCDYDADAAFEMAARGFVFETTSNYSVKESIIKIYELSNKWYAPAVEVKGILEDEFNVHEYNGKVFGIENVLNAYREPDEYSGEYEKRDRLIAEICYITGEHYKNELYKRIFWQSKCIKYGKEVCYLINLFDYNVLAYELGKILIEKEEVQNVDLGIEMLDMSDYDKACLFLSDLLLKGEIVERDLEKSFELLLSYNLPDFLYERGKRLFYGLGCEINIVESIKCFEKYLNEQIQDPDDKCSYFYLYKAIPFLTELYYEDLVLNNSVASLEKLQIYSEYHGNKMAQRYLWRYYSDEDNLYRDELEANKYKLMYKKGIRQSYSSLEITLSKIITGLELVTGYAQREAEEFDYVDYILSFGNHILYENEIPDDNRNEDDSITNSYYAVAEILLDKKSTNTVCAVRAQNYLENFLSLTVEKNSEKYFEALRYLLRSLIMQPKNDCLYEFRYNKALRVINYLNKNNENVNTIYKKVVYLRLLEKYSHTDNYRKIVECCDELYELGHEDYRCLSGCIKFIYLNEAEEGYNIINDCYYRYSLGEEVAINNITLVEYLIGVYRLKNVKRYEVYESLQFWKNAIGHCEGKDSSILVEIGDCLKTGKFEDDGLDISFDCSIDYELAFDAFCKGAILNNRNCILGLAEMLEEGLGFPSDIFAAKDFYHAAYEAGLIKANSKVRDLEGKIGELV